MRGLFYLCCYGWHISQPKEGLEPTQHLVPAHNQPHAALRQLAQAGTTHGAEGRVDLTDVRIGPTDREPSEARRGAMARGAFFCNSRISSLRPSRDGDGNRLSDTLILDLRHRQLPPDGEYDVLNVGLESNGRTTLIIDQNTRFIPRGNHDTPNHAQGHAIAVH